MNWPGFTCSYTTAKDVEGTSPCGRRATRRERGESKCLGHRAIEWLIAAYGGGNPERARSTYGTFFTVMFFVVIASGVGQAKDLIAGHSGEYAAVQTGLSFSLAGIFGGTALGFVQENPLGGKLWLTFAPISSVLLLLVGRSILSGANPSSTSRLADVLLAFVNFVIAVGTLAGWLVFLLEYVGRYRWATALTIFCEILFVVVVVAGVALALATHGTDSSLLAMVAILITLAIVVRGVNRLKKLARILRV
jgi:hypothetical protein